MDIVDQLNEQFEDPDITSMLEQSIETNFHLRFPSSQLTIWSTDLPVTIHVGVRPPSPPLDYVMILTDEWVDQDNFRFTFTNSAPPHDTIVIDLGE